VDFLKNLNNTGSRTNPATYHFVKMKQKFKTMMKTIECCLNVGSGRLRIHML